MQLAPAPISDRRIAIGRLAIVLTVLAWGCYVAYTVEQQFIVGLASSARLVIEAVVYLLMVTGLATSAMAYLITRIGYFYRSRAHVRAPRIALDAFSAQTLPSVTVLVPSYQEDERVIRSTLLTAALQEHPRLRIVLLIDDPQRPTTDHARTLLAGARALPGQIESELALPAARFRAASDRFDRALLATGADRAPSAADMSDLAEEYRYAVSWLQDLGRCHEIVDHTDTFFVEQVIGSLAEDLATVADALVGGAAAGVELSSGRLVQLHRRLVAIFDSSLTSFERKRYVSLSHEPNKAMNLNSYMSLMGGSFVEVVTPLGLALAPTASEDADLVVPDPDYVLTLDADSMLLPEYCLRMVHILEQSAFARCAVAQTPYSSFPGSATRLERISGASTDLQHIVHQGMTQYDASFWVGANAVLRKRALDTIVQIGYEGDWEIRRYIQDRTVIEDTESTIDLAVHGWSLVNYPERLAYSATPPDFGSLCIQRQRWANGGLLILPKLRDQVKARRARGERNRFGELFLRVNYMASICWSSICLLAMLCYPFNAALLNPILLLVSLPYFAMMAGDLRACGYRRSDVLRIYGFNLILLPVNLSGSAASILQLITGEKSAFKRTPKVRDRTTAPAAFILAPLLLIGLCAYTIVVDVQHQRWVNLCYATLNAVLASYAMVAFVGVRNSIVDLLVQLRDWLYRPVPASSVRTPAGRSGRRRAAPPALPVAGAVSTSGADWAAVLHYESPGVHAAGILSGPGSRVPVGRPGHVPRAQPVPVALVGSFERYTFFTVFQPIVDLLSGQPQGHEALTRFADGRPPRVGLADADADGRGIELDSALLRASFASAAALPSGAWISVNVSAGLLADQGALALLLASAPCPVVLEVGDGADRLLTRRTALPPDVRIAVDDCGPGYQSLARIDQLRPAFLKVGRSTIAGLETDAARRAFLRSLVAFGHERDCLIIATAVESEAERTALREVGVDLGQGFHLGMPVPVGHGSTRALAA